MLGLNTTTNTKMNSNPALGWHNSSDDGSALNANMRQSPYFNYFKQYFSSYIGFKKAFADARQDEHDSRFWTSIWSTVGGVGAFFAIYESLLGVLKIIFIKET